MGGSIRDLAMSAFLLSFLLLLAAPAQQTTAPNPDDLCTLQGVVVKAGTGEPLRNAIVELWPQGGPGHGQRSDAYTDSTGHFEFKKLDPGQYRLSARRNGYVRQQYGATKLNGPGSILSLSPGQKVSDITIQLIPAAVITGHVFDESGEPIEGAMVSPLSTDGLGGPGGVRPANTNDLGEFRIYGLAPGKYIVEAEKQPDTDEVHKSEPGYVPIYYPGVPDVERAAPITVRAGEEFSSADITLRTTHTVTLNGHVVSVLSGGAALHGQIFLVSQGTGTSHGRVISTAIVDGAQGAFTLGGVPAGAYFLCPAFFVDEGREESARQPIEVGDADLGGIIVTVAPGIDIKGHLRVEGKLDSSVGSLQVNLSPLAEPFFGSMPRGDVKPGGSFLLRNVFDCDYEIQIDHLPPNYFLKSARLDGTDVLTGVTIDTKQAPGLLDILVSPNGARLDGLVSKDQQPFAGALALLVPDPPHRGDLHLFKFTTTDQLGHFVLQGIPPGDYKLFAWENINLSMMSNDFVVSGVSYRSSEFLQPFEDRGQSIHITEGSHNSVQVDLIPAKDSSP